MKNRLIEFSEEKRGEKAMGINRHSEVEEAVRRFRQKESRRVLPLLRKKTTALVLATFLRSFSSRRRPMYVAKRVQRARLSSRRRFFTEDDVARAVRGTSVRLRALRRGGRSDR